jgi:hypothetical protein
MRIGILLLVALTLAPGCDRGHVASSGADSVVTERTGRGVTGRPESGALPDAQIESLKFAGSDRMGPKTSRADAPLENDLSGLSALLDTLPADDDMIEKFDALAETAPGRSPDEIRAARFSEARLPEETRNVRVQAWIFAAKMETDNDFHVILGSTPDIKTAQFMNAEVAGLPKQQSGDTATLQSVRAEFHDVVGKFPGQAYVKYTHPKPVTVEGSLFFDLDHTGVKVGPNGMKPDTSWEIHPITDLRAGHG